MTPGTRGSPVAADERLESTERVRAAGRLEAIRTYVSAVLSIMIVGGVIVAQFFDVDASQAMVGWGGAVVGFWLGARGSGLGAGSGGNESGGKF